MLSVSGSQSSSVAFFFSWILDLVRRTVNIVFFPFLLGLSITGYWFVFTLLRFSVNEYTMLIKRDFQILISRTPTTTGSGLWGSGPCPHQHGLTHVEGTWPSIVWEGGGACLSPLISWLVEQPSIHWL